MRTLFILVCVSALTSTLHGCKLNTDSHDDAVHDPDASAPNDDAGTAYPHKPTGSTAGSGGPTAGSPSPMTGGAGGAGGAADAGGPCDVCTTLDQPSRGAAVAFTSDDSIAVVVNRDVGSVTVLQVEYDKDATKSLRVVKEVLVGERSEPYQVVIGPDDDTAYVVLRRDQKLVKIGYLASAPSIVDSVQVGSEPTSLALSPSGHYVYVTNWNDGTVSEIDTAKLEVTSTIDLNAALVKTGYLGEVKPRAALAHPRSITISNNANGDDHDEALYVTEFYGQQIEAEKPNGENSDTRKVGLVYKVSLADYSVRTIKLSALSDIGFNDDAGKPAGCYPNQLQSIALNGPYAYVVSVCASPKGPLGVKTTTTACTVVADCAALNLVEPVCVTPFAGAANNICVDVASVKTSTAPVVSIIDTRKDSEVEHGATNLNARFADLYKTNMTEVAKQRFPLFASDISFVAGTNVGYVSANGIDAVFRLQVDAKTGEVSGVGSSTNLFIDLAPAGIAPEKAGRGPIGLALGNLHKKVAIVANDITRNATLLDFNPQAIAGGAMQAQVVLTSALPTAGSDADRVLRGKRFFNTGGARWSLRGQGWGACQSCHSDGLTDNVTWYFARGPRQATSLDGSFASKHPEDQRIFNWTAIFDEVADFEGNTRGISGGVGAIVSAVSVPPATADRIDQAGLGHAGLSGSSTALADPQNPLGLAAPSKLNDWGDIEKYMQSIRSPRAPSNLDAAKVSAGKELFQYQGSCQGCHGGEKWTVSSRFYTPSVATNIALNTAPLVIPADFPVALLPARQPANQTLRFNGGNAAAFDQILCAVRPVGSFNVAEAGVGIAELRADMVTPAQGDGNPAGEGRGYNVPSLLGVSTGAPYMHAGNARTLEALFSGTFAQHHQALAPNFLTETDPYAIESRVDQLVQYLLSIDEDSPYPALPTPGASGGSLCPTSF
jgi:YVTN family beta-propeller protein